uniref:Sperm flagellar membrane protein n=1 Tax=Sipha flava TaxID=143950 RepID=A0A2S2R302_9HEMI
MKKYLSLPLQLWTMVKKIEFTAMNDLLPSKQFEINPTQSIQTQETLKPTITENTYKPADKLKDTIKPSSVSKVSQKTEIQKPPKKNSPTKSEQQLPTNTITVKPDNTNVGGLINFGTIGSSLTALKPVISAVAGIIQNNLKNEQKTKNVHVLQKSTPKPMKQETTSRAPIYIPVGGLADSDGSESQQYPDTDQRHPHVGPARPPVEASLISGGIPISPGEVITTNSDVIIGKPSVLGPRPPIENSKKEETPYGMRPPIENSNREEIHFDIRPPIDNSNREEIPYGIRQPVENSKREEIPFGMRPPPPPQFKDKISVPNNFAREHLKNPLPHTDRKNNQPPRYHENRVQAQYQLTNAPIKSEVNIIPLSKPDPWPTKFVTDVQPLVLKNPDIQPQVSYGNQYLITSNQPAFLEQSSIDPLLVNIKPSQVAQVVIPHGSQTALIYSDQPAVGHGPKGEIFNDPQPYPENHVNPGFVGLEIYGTLNPTNNVASKIPANAMNFDIPVSPAGGITVGDSESHHTVLFDNETEEVKTRPVHVLKPPQISNNQYLTPPTISQVNSFVRRPDAVLSVEDDLLQFEDGEVTQESKKNPLRPGELPFGVHSSELDDDRTPIITGKPIVGNFKGEEQTLSIGQPVSNNEQTELKPGHFVVPNNKRPDLQYNIQHSKNEQAMINNATKQNKLMINVPPRDDIKQAMNMDEKVPPLPIVKHEHNDLESQSSTPQPSIVKPNRDNEVVGLSPPPILTHSLKHDNVTQRPLGSKRPYRPQLKPSTSAPPYQFERPLTRRPVKPSNNQEEMILKPLSTTAKIEPVHKWETPSNSRHDYRSKYKEEKPEILKAESKVISQGSNIKSNVQEKPNEKTVIFSGPVTNVIPTVITMDTMKWHEYSPISSTESKIETVQSTTETPALTSSTLGIIKSYTTPSKPTTSKTTDYHSVISVVVKNEEKVEEKSSEKEVENPTTPKQKSQMRPQVTILQLPERPSFMDEFHKQLHQGSSLPTRFVTHTQTLSVTITETTVLQSDGLEPSTHTLVLTKTQTSTLVDTVTEFHTLVKPTQVLSTITTTLPASIHSDPVLLAPVVEGTKTKTINVPPDENETLLVVMTDKKGGGGNHGIPPEIQVPDETNEIGPSDVLLSGILTHSSDSECRPECKASKNEICQRVENVMRCVCRPGFARIFMDRPCKPTYTYTMKLVLDKFRKEPIKYSSNLENPGSNQYQQLTEATREGLNRMSMQSDLRDIYHGVIVGGFEPVENGEKAAVSYIIQLSENAEDTKLWEATKKSLRATNYSLGGTDVFAARDQLQLLSAEDFDECTDSKFHDCSDNAKCFNLHGTYTCSCKEGFTDLSHNTQFPGRVCSSELIGCDVCNYHGTCYLSNQDQTICECFQWYAGKHCQFNLKVLLLGLIAIGVMLLSLLVACLLMACCKKRSRESVMGLYQPQRPVIGFRRYRNMIATTSGDKRAMISVDTGSETSVDHTPPPYVKQRQTHAQVHSQMKAPSPSIHGGSTMRSGLEQRDRSLTVMIPRAKYRSTPQQAPSILTMSTFGPEQKAMSYLDSRQTPTKGSRCSSRKPSDSTQRSVDIQPPQRKKHAAPRKPSTGALVSAGFEVSATVVKTKELAETYVGHEDDKPDFNTGRTTAARTVSVARSFDETTIQPPTRRYHPESHYESKSQYSHKTNDEGHTMVERDLGSTYLMPQSKLYKPDNRGSDTSNFDSL